jgi:hypothetical protein
MISWQSKDSQDRKGREPVGNLGASHGQQAKNSDVLMCRLKHNRSRPELDWPHLHLEYRQWSDLSLPELAARLIQPALKCGGGDKP